VRQVICETSRVGLFRRKARPGTLRRADSDDVTHLVAWAESRRGVEAYVEPRTAVTDTTVALVAHDGEWTRRRVEDERAAADLGKRLGIPVYDVFATGYPARMREYTRRRSEAERAARRGPEESTA
jgi:hypothetical protein